MRYALEDFPAETLHGCDIDRDAISWAMKSIPGPSFTRIAPFPPTSFANEAFDFVYGISIFTHLTEDVQKRWLEELRRVVRPKGIVAVSVLGEAGAPADIKPILERNGFADVLSPQSDEFAPYATDDYYRVTYHSPQYVFDTWAKYMNVLEYVEFGINSHQDLVIMEKAL
jgi:cyclopropane fatty-acyl-phospholipid synthase-like methyltransferase